MYGDARELFVFDVLQQCPYQRDVNACRLLAGSKLVRAKCSCLAENREALSRIINSTRAGPIVSLRPVFFREGYSLVPREMVLWHLGSLYSLKQEVLQPTVLCYAVRLCANHREVVKSVAVE